MLGVLCDLHSKATGEHGKYRNCSTYLPDCVVEWAGLKSCLVKIYGYERSLFTLNDELQLSFKELADIIEEQL